MNNRGRSVTSFGTPKELQEVQNGKRDVINKDVFQDREVTSLAKRGSANNDKGGDLLREDFFEERIVMGRGIIMDGYDRR